MRNLYESVQLFYEIRKNIDDANDKVETKKQEYGSDEVYKGIDNSDKKYGMSTKDTKYKTELGTYHGRTNGTGHHTVKWEPHDTESPMDSSTKMKMLSQMNAAHNKYREEKVENYDTMSVRKNAEVSSKMSKFLQRHKDFHEPRISDDKVTKDTIRDGDKSTKKSTTDKKLNVMGNLSATNAALRTTFMPHPSTRKPIATNDRNEYQQNQNSNITQSDTVLKDKYEAQKRDEKISKMDKIKSILNKKIF